MSSPDPLYYLRNFEEAISCVLARSGELLSEAERVFAEKFSALPVPARALLVRLVMRQGDLFRRSAINYEEIADLEAAIDSLVALTWLDPCPKLAADELFRLCTRAELTVRFPELRSRSVTKADAHVTCLERFPENMTFVEWLQRDEPVYRVTIAPVVSCFRWLFFGSDRPWSEFVLADLGIFKYESVPLGENSRPFNTRGEVEFFFALRRCEDALREGMASAEAVLQLPAPCTNVSWLNVRRERLQFQIGQLAEIGADCDLALEIYARCDSGEASVRQARLLERLARFDEAEVVVTRALTESSDEAELQKIRRIDVRLRRRRGERTRMAACSRIAMTELELEFEPDKRVELRVRDHLFTEHSPVFYVENSLICSLFGLLCWPAIFAPIRGAFFHRFHAAPVDLWTRDFVKHRAAIFDQCLAELDTGQYRTSIFERFIEKFDVRSPFVHWQALSADLLRHALRSIPAADLKLCFGRLLTNLRENCTGLPDLIQFNTGARGYRMIEVKGPGDQLQDNQRRWLAYCEAHQLPVEVLRVHWSAPRATATDARQAIV
jgi:hypothetical protein